jgi:cytosine/uracil/thiamine/allantoin permease
LLRKLEPFLFSILLPGAGHLCVGRTAVGLAAALLWTFCVHVILHGTWVVPKMFPTWAVPAAWVAAAAIWLWALVSLRRSRRESTNS